MEQLNSGDKLEVWDQEEGWAPFHKVYLTEATDYKLRYKGNRPNIQIQGIPIPFYFDQEYYVCTWTTPFQSGLLTLTVGEEAFEIYVYPDKRKVSQEQYNVMLKEIMEEAAVCFQYSGLEMHVDSTGKSRDISWPQWSYIEQNFSRLKQLFARVKQQPVRLLKKSSIMMKREHVQSEAKESLRWLDKKGYGKNIPHHVQSVKTIESVDTYENQVLKQQLIDLQRLIKRYEEIEHHDISIKAKQYRAVIQRWLNTPFLTSVTKNNGSYLVTQRFRKHPVYRGWYYWFNKLYSHLYEGIGFSYPIPLKDTFQLYEIWCYMNVLKVFREIGYLQNTKELFNLTNNGLVLDLAENKESHISLKGGLSLYYQRNYQYNSADYYTYTQRMIPDIVIEGKTGIVVLDPKYRVSTNIGTALGEMHKYRDGILNRKTDEKSVREVYILTPTKKEEVDSLRYFAENFHQTYGVGAVKLSPGAGMEKLKEKLLKCIDLLK